MFWVRHVANAQQCIKYVALTFALGCNTVFAGAQVPADGKKLLIVGQDTSSIDNYVNATGVEPGGVTGYINLSDLSGLTTDVDNGAGNNNVGRLFADYPNSTLAIAVYLVDQLDQINSGALDSQINQLINTLISWQRPIYLRWGYEFDGSWNRYESGSYIAAWQRMYNALSNAGADNVTMVWQSASYCPGTWQNKPFTDWYPGDAFVDMVGLSYFAPQDCSNTEINRIVDFARSKNLPVMIAESAPQRYDIGDLTYNPQIQRQAPDQAKSAHEIWNEWFVNYFNFIDTNSDVIKLVAYINADWDSQAQWAPPYGQGYWGDSRVEASPLIQSNWLAEIQTSDWLNASPDLFSLLRAAATPNPDPDPTPTPPQDVGFAFGLEADGTLYHYDGGQTGSWNFLCINNNCAPGTFNNGRWERETGITTGTHSIEFKIQDNASGQCIFAANNVAVGAGVTTSDCTDYTGDGSSTPDPDPDPDPVPDPDPTPDPGANGGFAFGLEADGTLYHRDGGQTGSWNYLCINSICSPGTRIDDRWERETGITTGSHNIEFKIQDNATGQCIFSANDIAPGFGVTASDCTDYIGDGTGNPPTDTQAPDIPTGLSATVENNTNINLSWNAASDNIGVTSYYLYRNEVLLTSVSGTGYLDSALSESSTYRYSISACDAAQNCSSTSAPVIVTTGSIAPPPPDDIPPSVPAGLNATQQNSVAVGLIWTPSSDNVGGVSYDIYRDTLPLTSVTGTSYVDSGVTANTTYTYSVSACDAAQNCSAQSAPVTITISDPQDQCSAGGDPGADTGEGFEAGITLSGIAYHREQPGAQRGFAIWGFEGSAPNLAGQQVLFTESNNNSYYRYEIDLGNLDPNTTYSLEMRLQGGEFGGGQCIQSFSLKPGEGVADAACYTDASGNVDPVEAPIPLTVGMQVVDAQNGKARLVSGETTENIGYALYTFDNDTDSVSNCSGSCESSWPKLTVAKPEDLKAAGGITGNFGTIARTFQGVNDCGETTSITDYQVTYNGKPLYFYSGDTSSTTTAGANLANWRLAEADLIPQLPLVKHPSPALRATINGLEPNNFGFAVDIDGRRVTWRPSGYNNHQAGLITQFSPYGGPGQPLQAKDPNLELWCSNNQIQFHKADMPGTLSGPYTAEFPSSCYGEFYYFFRYRIFGTVNLEPEDNWVYTALFVYDENDPSNRIDPRNRETVTYTSANWMRHGHPHSRDRPEEFITFDAMPYNTSLLSGLERYTTTVVDGPNTFNIQPNTNGALLRIEAFEWGAGNCQGPQYMINANNPIASGRFDYGQIVSWEATFGSAQNNFPGGTSISSQVYNTMQNNTIGMGFTSATGDPRLNLSGPAGVRLVHSNGCNPVEADERNARFTQQLTTVQSAKQVDDFIKGHNAFHGMAEVSESKPGSTGFAGGAAIVDVSGTERVPAGQSSCGSCHFRDGRSEFVVQTAKGPRLAPPTYGVGLLEWIEGAETGLTWDGSAVTVAEQSEIALLADLDLLPSDIGQEIFEQIVVYTETLHVPVRDYKTYSDPDVAEGETLFYEADCQSCHQVTQKTRSDAPVEFRDLVIRPYTDMKLWNVNGGDFRTAPLWAIGQNIELLERNGMQTLFMHDGSASTLDGAIQKHTDDGAASRALYNSFSESEKQQLIKFLRSL